MWKGRPRSLRPRGSWVRPHCASDTSMGRSRSLAGAMSTPCISARAGREHSRLHSSTRSCPGRSCAPRRRPCRVRSHTSSGREGLLPAPPSGELPWLPGGGGGACQWPVHHLSPAGSTAMFLWVVRTATLLTTTTSPLLPAWQKHHHQHRPHLFPLLLVVPLNFNLKHHAQAR